MDIKKLKLTIPYFVILIIAFTGFIIGTFLDKDISSSLTNTDSALYSITILIGVLPGVFVALFACFNILNTKPRSKKSYTITLRIIALVLILAIMFFAYDSTSEIATTKLAGDNETLFKLICLGSIIIVLVLSCLTSVKFTKKIDSEVLLKTSIMIVAIYLIYAGGTEFVKYIVSRPRPRIVFNELSELHEEYRAWYQFKPLYGFKNKECKSFVSGHAANTATLMTLIPLFISLTSLGNKKGAYVIGFTVGALFSLFVASTRVLCLAHFLSDVSGAIIICVLVQIVVVLILPLIYKKLKI